MVLQAAFLTLFIVVNLPDIFNKLDIGFVFFAILPGFGASIMWIGQGAYTTESARLYALCTGKEETASLGLFNGIFWFCFQATQIAGNLLSSLVLSKDKDSSGAPPYDTTMLLIGIYCGLAGLGTVLLCFLRRVDRAPAAGAGAVAVADSGDDDTAALTGGDRDAGTGAANGKGGKEQRSTKQRLLATTHLFTRDMRMTLLVPLLFYTGFEQSWAWGSFTKDYVSVTLSSSWVGYAMVMFGAADALSSLVFGNLSDRIGRFALLLVALAIQGGVGVFLLAYTPAHGEYAAVLPLAVAWGVADGILQTLVGALLGAYWSDDSEPAFANLKLWQSLAMAAGLGLSSGLGDRKADDLRIQMYILLSALVLSAAGLILLNARQSLDVGTARARGAQRARAGDGYTAVDQHSGDDAALTE